MDKCVVIIGLGQLGRVFAGGLLRTGHTVVPVNRGDDMDIVAARWPEPDLVLVAVAEPELHTVLAHLPPSWRPRIGLLQNELLPRDWIAHKLTDPTVICVWFEKKKGMDPKPLLPSPAYGPQAGRLVTALGAVDIPARTLGDADTLLWELKRKNLYILTSNIAGLAVGGDVGTLWERHRELAEAVAAEVLDIQDWLAGSSPGCPENDLAMSVAVAAADRRAVAGTQPTGWEDDRLHLMEGLLQAFQADPLHGCAGRSAPGRLRRALAHADEAGLAVPALRNIAARHC